MKRVIGLVTCSLLAGCVGGEKKVIEGPSPGIEYHNQDTAPWPWVSVIPSDRALALKGVSFDALARQIRHEISLPFHADAFKDVRIILLDYTMLPHGVKKSKHRPERYFMVASFYKIGKRPPSPPDFEVTTSIIVTKAGRREAMRYMLEDIVEEVHTLYDQCMLTPGKKITVNLD